MVLVRAIEVGEGVYCSATADSGGVIYDDLTQA